MFSSVWDFLKDIAAGIRAVVTLRGKSGDRKPSQPGVSADRGSVAAGGDIKSSPINISARSSSEPTARKGDHKRSKRRGGSKRSKRSNR
jgi:hypothetical protein